MLIQSDFAIWVQPVLLGGQAGVQKGGPTPHVLDPQFPHQPATVSAFT